MSIGYKDGSFSENMPVDEALEKFKKQLFEAQSEDMLRHIDGKRPKALHVGTEEELNDLKARSFWPQEEKPESDLQAQIDELREKVELLEGSKSSVIEIPTKEQVRQFIKEDLLKKKK